MNPHFGLTNTPRISASIVCLIIEHTFFLKGEHCWVKEFKKQERRCDKVLALEV